MPKAVLRSTLKVPMPRPPTGGEDHPQSPDHLLPKHHGPAHLVPLTPPTAGADPAHLSRVLAGRAGHSALPARSPRPQRTCVSPLL